MILKPLFKSVSFEVHSSVWFSQVRRKLFERVESSSSCGRMAANSNSVGLDNAARAKWQNFLWPF